MKKVTQFFWLDHRAKEAANYNVSGVFKNWELMSVNRADNRVMTVNFELDGQQFIALNAGPHFKFTQATSFGISNDPTGSRHVLGQAVGRRREVDVRLAERTGTACRGRLFRPR